MNDKTVSAFASAGMLFTAAIWGFAFVVVKDSLDTVPPIYMLAFRFTIAAAALALIFHGKLVLLDAAYLAHGALLGFFLFTAYAFQTVGCMYTTAGKNAFLTTIYVVLVPLIGWVLTKRRPDAYVFAAAVLAVTGIGLLSLQDDFSVNKGDVLTLICGVGYAVHIIFIARYNATQDAVLLTVLQLFFAAVFSWMLAPLMDGGFPAAALRNGKTVASMLYLGVFSTMIAFLLQNVCQKYTLPSVAALFLSMESVFGVFFSCVFLGEVLTVRMVSGCVLLFTAIILAETKFSFIANPLRRLVHRLFRR